MATITQTERKRKGTEPKNQKKSLVSTERKRKTPDEGKQETPQLKKQKKFFVKRSRPCQIAYGQCDNQLELRCGGKKFNIFFGENSPLKLEFPDETDKHLPLRDLPLPIDVELISDLLESRSMTEKEKKYLRKLHLFYDFPEVKALLDVHENPNFQDYKTLRQLGSPYMPFFYKVRYDPSNRDNVFSSINQVKVVPSYNQIQV